MCIAGLKPEGGETIAWEANLRLYRIAAGYAHAEVEAVLRSLHDADPIRIRENRKIYRALLHRAGASEPVFVKVDAPLSRFQPGKWTRFTFSSPHRAAWRFADALAAFHFHTPAPIALFEERVAGILVRSVLITQYIQNARTLDHDLDLGDLAQNRCQLARLMDWVGALHRNGFYHADLKGSNLLISGEDFYPVDFERARFHATGVPARKRIRDVRRIHRMMMRVLPQDDRRQLLARYDARENTGLRTTRLFQTSERKNRGKLIQHARRFGVSALGEMRYAVRKILAIALRYIGDTLLMTPALQALRETFPAAEVHALVPTGTNAMLVGHPAVDRILHFDHASSVWDQARLIHALRRAGYDLAIDFTDADRPAWMTYLSGAPLRLGYDGGRFRHRFLYNVRVTAPAGSLHQVDRQLALVGKTRQMAQCENAILVLSETERKTAQRRLAECGVTFPFVLFHPGARRWYKSWPPEFFSALGDQIVRELGVAVVLVGGASDAETLARIRTGMVHPTVDLSSPLDLRAMAGVMQRASVCVVNDSAPMHIAAAVGTPVVALFGLTDPAVWGPRGTDHCVLRRACACSPYGHRRECDQGATRCMRQISVGDVLNAVRARVTPEAAHAPLPPNR